MTWPALKPGSLEPKSMVLSLRSQCLPHHSAQFLRSCSTKSMQSVGYHLDCNQQFYTLTRNLIVGENTWGKSRKEWQNTLIKVYCRCCRFVQVQMYSQQRLIRLHDSLIEVVNYHQVSPSSSWSQPVTLVSYSTDFFLFQQKATFSKTFGKPWEMLKGFSP